MRRILITGAGGSPATNFVRSLRAAAPDHLVGVDADPYHLMRAETDVRYLVPRADDPDYLDVLNDVIDAETVEMVHAQNDVELRFLSEHRDDVRATTFLPDRETVRICQDKFASFERWKGVGLPVPETILIATDDDLVGAFETFGGELWLRATEGAGGRGALPVTDLRTARAWLDLHQGWGTFTAAELLEPSTVTWMSIWHEGELVVAQSRMRLYWELAKVSPSGVTGATGGAKTVRDERVDEIARRAILAIDERPHGLFGVDMTYDRAGTPNPTEINIGRFFTTHHFFTALGLNMPDIFVTLALGGEPVLPETRINPLPAEMVWIRGIDFLPVLSSTAEIEQHESALQERRHRLGR